MEMGKKGKINNNQVTDIHRQVGPVACVVIRTVVMSDLRGMNSYILNLKNYNSRDWPTGMKSYLQGQGLWKIVGGDETELPSNLI